MRSYSSIPYKLFHFKPIALYIFDYYFFFVRRVASFTHTHGVIFKKSNSYNNFSLFHENATVSLFCVSQEILLSSVFVVQGQLFKSEAIIGSKNRSVQT